MPFIPGLRLAKATFNMEVLGQAVANTIWMQLASGNSWDTANLVLMSQALEVWWDTYYAPLTSTGVALRNVHVRSWENESGGQWFTTSSSVGENAGEILPTNDTFCIAFKSAQSGRNYQGRNYFVGLTISQVASNMVDSAVATAIQNAYLELPAAINETITGTRHVIASFIEDYVPREAALITEVQAYLFVDRNLDSQRRRLSGRGT